MKLFSRIMVILMTLVLVFGVSIASAAPANISEIEGLPECPEAPEMKVKKVKEDYTITLSAPLTWLNVVQNWNWMDIIKWNEEKTVGTYSAAGLKSAPGTGTWNNHASWEELLIQGMDQEEAEEYAKEAFYVLPYAYENYDEEYWMYDDEKDYALVKEFAQDNPWWPGGHYYVGKMRADEVWEYDEEAEEWVFDSYGVWKPVTYNMFGTYPMDGAVDQFAYEGGLEDGSKVRYAQSGKVVKIFVTKTGVNYLGGDKEPVETTVTFRRMHGKMYICSITEKYDDDTERTAEYNYNGVLMNPVRSK